MFLAVDHRNRLAPVSLARKHPVAEFIIRLLATESFELGFLGELDTSFGRGKSD